MRGGAALLVLCAASACAELRLANDVGADGGPLDGGAEAAGVDGSTPTGEGGSDASDARPPAKCDGPCPSEELAADLAQVTALSVDDKNVYFAIESGAGTVFQCPKTGCGGAPIPLGEGYTIAISVDAQRVYWGDFAAGKLVSCTIGGCANMPTAVALNQSQIRGVWTDGADLVWSTADDGGSIMHCTPGACSPAAVKTGQGLVLSVAADQGKVFWGNLSSKSLHTCATSSCTSVATLGPGVNQPTVHAGVAYWIDGQTNTLVRCPASGCAGTPITIGSSPTPAHPISDGVDVYWRDDLLDAIYRCPVAGCMPGPEVVATNQRGQLGGQIALDGQYVYWTTTSGVYRVRK